MTPIITLLTDFGTVDGYVGAMKGVILTRAPGARIVDLTHEVPAQSINAGAWALLQAAPYFPEGTIHVAVVDPGVGTDRHPILLEAAMPEGRQIFIGPDNGLLDLVSARASARRCYVLDQPQLFLPMVSTTFHGRDIFAAVAGHLAAGVSPARCGTPVEGWEPCHLPAAERRDEAVVGEVVHVDHFGNLITNIDLDRDLSGAEKWAVSLAGRDVGPIRATFSSVAAGAWVAYVGSSRLLEIAIRQGRAVDAGHGLGAEVRCLPEL